MHLLDFNRWRYLLRGFVRQWTQPRICPCCGDARSTAVDSKAIFTLRECGACHILYRHPYETATEMKDFYQDHYEQDGLTTELPGPDELELLKQTRFVGSGKDASRLIDAIAALGLRPGARVLDYGANWGYTAFQLNAAGYQAEAYEVSKPRAEFGRKLGMEIRTNLDSVSTGFDAIYSGHVLEHLANPLQTLRWMCERVKPGGFVVAHTPNGSAARRQAEFRAFHLHWGLVHPVLLCDRFLTTLFGEAPLFLSSDTNAGELSRWAGQGRYIGQLDGGELFLVIRRAPTEVAQQVPESSAQTEPAFCRG